MIIKNIPTNEVLQHTEGWQHTYSMAKPFIKNFTHAIDVGAREGGFAREIENDFQHIYCYDFRKKYLRHFWLNVNDNKKFTYKVCGIGEENGTAYTRNMKAGRIKNSGTITVPMRTLDSFNFDNIGYIKMDIEGYELKALKGAEQTIKKFWPVVTIEQNQGNIFAQELLESWGYKCKGIDKVFNQDYLMVKK